MLKSKLLVGALAAAFALAGATDVVYAAKAKSKAHPAPKHTSMTMTDINKVPNCGKGKTPQWNMMAKKPHWSCVKPA